MTSIYTYCAVIGGTLFLTQFLLGLLGLGGHHDFDSHDVSVDHDAQMGHDANWFAGVLTFRSLVAALTAFGLGGLAADAGHFSATAALAWGLGCGLAALLLVAQMMRLISRLRDDGTLRLAGAVGRGGTVYLTIPGNKSGLGKITLTLQNRTVECQAVTFQGQLPTGSKVRVVSVVSGDTVEVVAQPECGPASDVPVSDVSASDVPD